MIEIMDKCGISESSENLSSYSNQLDENSSASNVTLNGIVTDFSKKMNSSVSSLTSPVDSGVVLFDELDLPLEIRKEPHVCEIQDITEIGQIPNQSTPLASPNVDHNEDEIVHQRRSRKKILKDIKNKRVSFHEDVDLSDKTEVSKDIKVIVGQSNEVSIDNEDFPTEKALDLNGSVVLSSNFNEPLFSIEKMFSKLKNQLFVPLAERGVPEGQEDPLHCSFIESNTSFSGNPKPLGYTKPLESDRSYRSKSMLMRNVLAEAPSKAPLVNRFLQSLQMKEFRRRYASSQELRHQVRGFSSRRPLVVKTNLNDINFKSFEHVLNELNDEVSVNLCNKMESCWYRETEQKLEKCVFKETGVEIYKIFQVLSTAGEPLLAVLTDTSLVVFAVDKYEYVIQFYVYYNNIKIVIVGPNNLTLMFIERERLNHCHYTIVTDSESLHGGNDLMSHLEVAALRNKSYSIPVYSSSIHDEKKFLRKTSIEAGEESIYCQWVWLQQVLAKESHPLGPVKEGYVMYRQSRRSKWAPSFILLKAGVIYVFVDSNLKIPIHVIHLKTQKFKGSKKSLDPRQPHAFEVSFEPDISVQFAPATEEELFEWLDAISLSTFSAEDSQLIAKYEMDPVIGCCLLLTTKHIVMYQLPCEVLSCLSLQTLNVVKFSSSHSYCILEFDCCEANETNGDWVIHFTSDQGLNKFYNVLSSVLPNLDQITDKIDVPDESSIRCMERNDSLKNAWACFLISRNKLSSIRRSGCIGRTVTQNFADWSC